jgi:hypothetical protein
MYISKYPILSQKDPTLFFPIVQLILAFETAHGAGHQLEALFLIDNSQCHSAYSEDALLASRMNVKPGGKQAHMRNGWYWSGGQKTIQICFCGRKRQTSHFKGMYQSVSGSH